jgi:penicillin-insensitive murein DD-endopeptidase
VRFHTLAFSRLDYHRHNGCHSSRGTLDPQPLPALAKPDDPATPAKESFGRRPRPAPLEARVIGFYSKGCLAGAKALPINGKTWQVMRLSRNRNWGHPKLVQRRSPFR